MLEPQLIIDLCLIETDQVRSFLSKKAEARSSDHYIQIIKILLYLKHDKTLLSDTLALRQHADSNLL